MSRPLELVIQIDMCNKHLNEIIKTGKVKTQPLYAYIKQGTRSSQRKLHAPGGVQIVVCVTEFGSWHSIRVSS
jgi:hypothetical protein